MSYHGRPHGRISTNGLIYQLLKRDGRSKKVYHEESAEVIVDMGNEPKEKGSLTNIEVLNSL